MSTHVFETMGTVVSLAFRLDPPDRATQDEIEREFARWDDRYSLYRPNSELSRVASGEIDLTQASEHLLSTYGLATEWRSATGGAFTAHRPDGVIDLSGIVKAEAIRAAGDILQAADVVDWAITVGGDLLISPARAGNRPWTVGIVDPSNRGELLTSIALSDGRRACATSGVAERGDHIWRTTAAPHFAQATVVADDIVTADVLATAIIAGGTETLDLACRTWSIDVITVDDNGDIRMTAGAARAMHLAAEQTSELPTSVALEPPQPDKSGQLGG
jgi:FAD:protein FMN transferase